MYCLLSYDLFKLFLYDVVPGHGDIIHNINHQKSIEISMVIGNSTTVSFSTLHFLNVNFGEI